MSHDAVLSVLVKIDGIAAAIAKVETFESAADQAGDASDHLGSNAAKAAKDVDKLGGEIDQAAKSARAATSEVEKAAKATGSMGDSAQNAAKSTATMGREASAARAHVNGLAGDIEQAAKTTDLWQDSQGRWRNGTGQFASAAEKMAAGVRAVGNEFDGLHKKKSKTDDLIDKNVRVFGAFSGVVAQTRGAVSALGGGFGPLMSAFVLAGPLVLVLAGAAIALASALAPLGGLAGAGAVGLLALGQAAGVAALASMGVGDALKEQVDQTQKAGKVAQTGADQQRAAARAIESAQDGVRSATEQLAQADRDERAALAALGPARQQAKRDLEDLRNSLVKAYEDQREAALSLRDARKTLDDTLHPDTVAKVTAAQAALTTSTLSEQRAVLGLTDARQHLQDLLKPADALTLADAQDAVADATRGQTRAALELADAQAANQTVQGDPTATAAQKAKAALDLADAQNAVGDATRATQHAEQQLLALKSGPDPQAVAKAKQDVADAENAVADATRGTAQAQTALQDAQKGPDPLEVAKARLQVSEAEHRVADAATTTARAQKDLAEAEKKGIDRADGVVQANQRIADAHREVRDAQLGVVRANEQLQDAQANAASSSAGAATAAQGLNEKFNALPPAAQAFVRELQGMKPKLDDLRATAAAGLFPGVIQGMRSAMDSFGSVKKVVGETSGVLGGLAKRAGDLVGSSSFGKDIETVGRRNALIIDRLGRAAIYVGDALRHVVVAAGPLTTWLAKVAVEWAKNADGAVRAARQSGALGDFFQKVRNTLITVVSILGNLGEAFFNVGKASAPFGRDMLKSIDAVTGKFAEWTKSVGGQKALQTFFREAATLAKQLAPALAGVAGSLGGMAFRVLPAYIAILNALGPLAGPLVQIFVLWKLALTGVTVATQAVHAAEVAWTVATKVAAAAQWLLNAALDANPIGLVVIAIAALAAGIIYAYKHSETFRDIVNGVWHAIESVARPVIEWLTGAIPAVWDALTGGAQAVLDFLSAHWPAILAILGGPIGLFVAIVTGHLGDVLAAFTALPNLILNGIEALPGALKTVGGWMLDRIIEGFKAIVTGIKDAAKWLLDRVVELIKLEVAGYKLVGSWVLDRVVDGFKAVTDLLKTAGGWLIGQIEAFVHLEVTGAKAIGSWITDRVANGFKTVTDALSGVGDWLSTNLSKIFDGAKGAFTGLGGTLIDWIVDGFKGGIGKLAGFAKTILDIVGKIPGVGGVADKGKEAIDKVTKSIGLARGGAFGRTGGYVDRPMVFMGEEAPQHPEFVIPTNPAYRGRAKGLLAQAAGALGFAQGGINVADYNHTYPMHHTGTPGVQLPPAVVQAIAASVGFPAVAGEQIAHGESDFMPGIVEWPPEQDGAQGYGLMQMTTGHVDPPVVALINRLGGWSQMLNPVKNFTAAEKLREIGGLGRWHGTKYLTDSGGGGGVLGSIGHAVSGAVDAVTGLLADGAKALLGKLPSPDDLGWLKGAGTYALDKVSDWIKDKASSVLGGGPGGGGGNGQTDIMDGYPVADWIYKILAQARQAHVPFTVSSGFRTDEEQLAIYNSGVRPAAVPRALGGPGSNHEGTAFPEGAVDISPGAAALNAWLAGSQYADKLIYAGSKDPVHFSHPHNGGYYMGGVFGGLPYAGSFDGGGIVPGPPGKPYAAVVHGGEEIGQPGRRSNGPLVHIENAVFKSEDDSELFARKLGWQLR